MFGNVPVQLRFFIYIFLVIAQLTEFFFERADAGDN